MTIQPGMVFSRSDAAPPAAAGIGTAPWSRGWRVILDLGAPALGESLARVGWNLFCWAGSLHASSLGWDRAARTHPAVRRLLRRSRREDCNCLEITAVVRKRFLGLPYTRVEARGRQMQPGPLLSAVAPVEFNPVRT